MPPTKVCEHCSASVHIRKLVCACGHVFGSKKSGPSAARRVAVGIRRSLESDVETAARKATDSVRKAKERALENEDQRKKSDRACTAKKRASETPDEALRRQECDRACTAKKRASETPDEALRRQECDRARGAITRASETPGEALRRQECDRARGAIKRASETPDEALRRQECDRARGAIKRASETPDEALRRQESNRTCTAKKRALETQDEALCRRECDTAHAAGKRALESSEDYSQRKQSDRAAISKRRSKSVSIECAISAFHAEVKFGPDFVCTCCHRMMYRKSVILCNRASYTKASSDVLLMVFSPNLSYISSDGKEWVCRTCDRTLKRGNMPVQAKANGLQLCQVPPDLSSLNALELRLICLRVPFMKMVALPTGKQRSIHGPAVNVPSKVDTICDVLPRLPSQTEMVPLKLKRKVAYRGHYMYDYVTPQKPLGALRFLKTNNPLYCDIEINDQWFEEAIANDDELGMCLVEQNDESMDTESDQPETESEPMECCGDELSLALQKLKKLAFQNGFTIYDVPYDGNCMFSAISHQLQTSNVCDVDSSELRQMVASHMEANAASYRGFVCQPVATNSKYNADTEPPTDEDEYINSVSDPELQTQLRWDKYLRRLRQGAWGDHINMQAIADMLSVKINVLSSDHPVASATPSNSSATCEMCVGLIRQYHYVGLDKMCDSSVEQTAQNVQTISADNVTVANTDSHDTETADDALDDAVIAEGDEHRIQISGAPMASMMCVENPESFREIICVAPAEGEKPLNIMTDSNFEAMSNPDKFPFGVGTYTSERPRKLTYRKYFNQRLLDVDGRFARDLDYLFVAQYIVEAKQVSDDGNNFVWRQKPSRQFTAAQARDQTVLNQYVRKDRAYSFMKNIRGSPPYYQRTFYDLLAMIRQLGTPTWFFTLSAADLKWPDMIQTIAKQYGVHYTDDEVAKLSFDEKSNWLKRNPVTAARHFHYRLTVLFQGFLKSTAKPLGEIADYAIRIEFQARGSPHAHCVIWVKDAPEYGVDHDSQVCDFIDQYVSCKLPKEDGKLRELVLLLQQHKHSSYCKRNKSCRFNFPKPPSSKTLIAKSSEDDDDVVAQNVAVLSKVQKLIAEGNTDMSLDDLLEKAEVSETEYTQALEVSSKGNVVVLRREPNECSVNNYNPSVMLAWQANMDIQFVLNAYACVMYVASYIMKTERSMGELLKRVATEARTDELKVQLRKVGSAFLTHRELSAQEAAYRLLSIPMKQLSRSVVFVNTNPKNERIAVLKSNESLSQLDDSDTNVFQKSLIDRYQHRPRELQSMCLAEFAAKYVVKYERDDGECDALPASESDTTSTQITLTDGFGRMNKCRVEAVIRFRKYNKESEPSNWYRAKLMLYYPWYNEQTDLLGGYSSYAEQYRHVSTDVYANESKYTKADIEDVDVDEDGPPEHLWSNIAPSTEESRAQSMAEGVEQLTEVSQQDLHDNQAILTSGASALHVRFEGASNCQEIPADQYRQYLRELNEQQRSIVMFHRDWCKKTVVALKEGKPVEPYHVFLSGPGGVGKSHVIKLIHSDTLKFLKLSGIFEPDDVIALLTAPTGVAAFNISGMTLHSALLLGRSKYSGFQPLSHERLNSLRSKLSRLMLVIIDEVSMVGSNMLLEIHKRLQQIKGVSDDAVFGGVSILAVGDLYQLPPVGQAALFSTVSDSYAQLYGSGSLWVDQFQMIELTEVMRQRGDSPFSELLCRVRTNSCTSDDIDTLKSIIIPNDAVNYPTQALHVYRLNVDVDSRNALMLDNLAPQIAQYTIKARDARAGQTTHISLSAISDKRSETGGLHGILKLAIGARVMLTTNVDVSDGLVNGARGEVVHVVTNNDDEVTHVLVKFDNNTVGRKSIQTSQYRSRYPHAVPLAKYEVVFFAKGKRGSEITRLQFPLTLAWATTIHKVQGLTLDEIVVDMKGGRFSPGQAYVAFSRVKTLEGLHIVNFNAKAIKKSIDVANEMIRLNTKVLPPMPQVMCDSSCLNIALLNVRSIRAKLPDLLADETLCSTTIQCFCETWLNASQSSPVLQAEQIDIRCDKLTCENKGGVMMCVPSQMQPSDTQTFTTNGIEAVSCMMVLPNLTRIQIALVYRSPSVSRTAFVTVLTRLLRHVSVSNTPCVILGDFNEDLLLHQPNSPILSLMSEYSFTQLVESPTTPQGTLLDHVYYNGPPSNITIQVKDSHYSDHDTVYCSLLV